MIAEIRKQHIERDDWKKDKRSRIKKTCRTAARRKKQKRRKRCLKNFFRVNGFLVTFQKWVHTAFREKTRELPLKTSIMRIQELHQPNLFSLLVIQSVRKIN